MKIYIYILDILIILFLSGCKEKKEYDFSNKYFELEPEKEVKVDAFGFYLSQPIKGVAFYDNKIFINTHNREGIELVDFNKEEMYGGKVYKFSDNEGKFAIFVRPADSTGLVRYNEMYYNILKIRDAAERKKKALPSYNQIEEYVNNGCVIGKVKRATLSRYEIKIAFEKYVKEKVAEEICHYDTIGRLINHMVYEISPKDGRRTLETEYLYRYEGQNKVYYRCKKYGYMEAFFDCNAFGEEDGRGYLGEIIYKYNKQNQLIAIKQNGEYERNEQEYFYSGDSLLVEIRVYDFSHKLINVTKVKRKKGGGTQLFKYSGEGERKRVLTYDNKGYLISNIPYSNAEESYWGWRQEIEYSLNMVILKNLRRESGGGYREHIEKDILSFDTYGNILKRFSTYRREPFKSRPDLEVYETEDAETFSYIYDERGNWIRLKVVDSRKEHPVIIERDIEYY